MTKLNKMKQTPTPWKIETSGEYLGVYNSKGERFAGTNFPTDSEIENWRFIVRAVNSHEALLEVCRDIWNAHRTANNGAYAGEAILCPSFAIRIEKAIAQAEGK